MSYTEREPRMAVEMEIEMKDFSFIKTAEESSLNLSQGGAFIKMDEPYSAGTLVKFKLKTPENGIIDGVGKVAWFRKPDGDPSIPGGVGIKFLKMSDEGRALLEGILENADVISSSPAGLPAAETAAIAEKTSTAPAAGTSDAPKAKISTPPSVRTSDDPAAPEKTEAKPEECVSAAPNTDRVYNAKKTQTISFPPKGVIPSEPSEEASKPAAAAEVAESAAPSVGTEGPSQKSPPAQASVASMESTTATEEAIEKPQSSGGNGKLVAAAVVLIAIAIGAWAILGMDGGADTKTSPIEPSQDVPATPPVQVNKTPVPPPAPPATPIQAAPADVSPAPEGAAAAAPIEEGAAEPSEGASAEPTPAPTVGEKTTVEVIVDPPEAVLTVNGTDQAGTSPFQVQLPKNEASTLSARAAGFLTQTIPFTPSEETPSARIDLAPARIKFQMNSTPPGARILIDGKFNGTTPYTFLRKKYKPDYHWEIEKKGFESVEGTVSEDQWVEEGRYYIFTLDVELTRKKPEAGTDPTP